ncbi:MAG: beta-ketoacyl synthase chain length factor [Planctomycetes bacterium]|nr:beta-ketoacyl synthase chain length factor [Planctomycetota bacterium]
MAAIITGVGVVSSLGADPVSFAKGLRGGRSGCALHDFEYLGGRKVSAPAYLAMPADAKGLIDPKKLRRMDRLSRMCAVSARQALAMAGIDASTLNPARTGVVFGTAFGAMATTQAFVDSWLKQGERHASPLNFMNSVHGIMASLIALDLGITGVNLTLSQRDLSFEGALVTALEILESGEADTLIVGAGDELTPLLHDFGARVHYVNLDAANARGLDPFAPTDPTVPGDGAAVIVLERADSKRKPLAKFEAAAMGRLGKTDLAAKLLSSDLRSIISLATTNRGGSKRAAAHFARRENALDGLLGRELVKLTHRGNFGDSPSAGALQCVANVLMLSGGEVFAPLAAGEIRRDLVAGVAAPTAILHDAASVSGTHAAYVLTQA